MPLSITLPLFGKAGNAQDLAVSILADESPLTAKEVYGRAVKAGGNLTYQAIHKALGQLEKEGVVTKTAKNYTLSPQWIEELAKMSKELAAKQSKTAFTEKSLLSEGNLQFDNLADLARFVLDFHDVMRKAHPEAEVNVNQWRHVWPAVLATQEDYARLKSALGRKVYLLIRSDTPVDRWMAKYFTETGAKVKLGVDCAGTCDLKVLGDYVVSVFFSEKFREWFDKTYQLDPAKVDLNAFYKAAHELRSPINVTIVKNKALAEQLTKETLQRFQ